MKRQTLLKIVGLSNKKFILITTIFSVLFVIMMPLVFAHVEEGPNTSHQEEAGLGHQFKEILPFHHFAEGHLFAGIMLILF